MKSISVEHNHSRKRYFAVALAFGILVIMVFALAHAAGRVMPKLDVTGGRSKTYKFKSDYEAMIKPMNLQMLIKDYRTVTWADAMKWFDMSKTLPHPTAAELTYSEGFVSKHQVKTQYMPDVFAKLVTETYTDPKYGLKTPPVADEDWLRTFGDIMAHFKTLRGKASETDVALTQIKTQYPAIWAEVGDVLPSIVQNDYLYSTKWDPYKDESAPGKNNDGVVFFPYWKMTNGGHHVYQGGIFMYASREQIKVTERNFKEYVEYVGMGNLEVAPLAGSYIRGVDNKGDEFMGIEVFNSGILPFPYNMASYVMKMLDYYKDNGRYVCEYYSENRADLNYMSGRDSFYDVVTAKGEYVGQLIASEIDFDIKNVPEGDKDRIVSIRGNWGNIKLIVEGYKGLSKVSTGPGQWGK